MKKIPSPYSFLIPIIYVFFSLLLLLPVFSDTPLIIGQLEKHYDALGADIPAISKFVLVSYNFGYILLFFTVLTAVVFYKKNSKQGASLAGFIFLNLFLFLSLAWNSLVNFSILLPVRQLISAG